MRVNLILAAAVLCCLFAPFSALQTSGVRGASHNGTKQDIALSNITKHAVLSQCKGRCCDVDLVRKFCSTPAQKAQDEQPNKLNLTLQLDASSTATDLRYFSEVFNRKNSFVHVTLKDTPVPKRKDDIDSTNVTVKGAQARWTDVSSTGTDDLASPGKLYGSPFFLYYRADVFRDNNVQPPATWDELLEVAKKLNGRDMDNKKGGEYALCFSGALHCQAHYVLMSILSSMTQGSGEGTMGWLLDPESMKPLVNNAAMRKALTIYRQMVKYADPQSLKTCSPYDKRMAASKCAMVINRSSQFVLTRFEKTSVAGFMSTAPLPGSTQILDRGTGSLVPCNSSTCPHATLTGPNNSTQINKAPLFTPFRRVILRGQETIENVPDKIAISSFDDFYTAAMFEAYTTPSLVAVGVKVSTSTVLSAPASASVTTNDSKPSAKTNSAINLALTQDFDLESLGVDLLRLAGSVDEGQTVNRSIVPKMDLPAILSVGYDLIDGGNFLPRLVADLNHKNRANDILLPGASYMRLVLAEGAVNATAPGADLDQIMATMETKMGWILEAFGNTSEMQQIYLQNIDFLSSPLSQSRGVTGSAQSDSFWTTGLTAAVVLVSLIAFVALLVGTVLLIKQSRTKVLMLLGTVAAPGLGPATTLLVTDIQNSTVMWEQLPGELMADVMKVHHRTLRGLLDKHGGYESATEGDSFIIAFHNPVSALSYAIEVQAELLNAEWPKQLLDEYEEAGEVRAEARTEDAEAKLSATTRYLQNSSATLTGPKRNGRLVGMLTSFRAMMKNVSATYESAAATSTGWFGGCFGGFRQRAGHGRSPAPQPPRRGMTRAMTRMVSRVLSREVKEVPVQQAGSNSDWDLDPSELEMVKDVNTCCTLGQSLSKAWSCHESRSTDLESGSTCSGSLVWRGLRVRIGIHTCGEEPMVISNNRTSRRTQYSGAFANTAKYVSDAGHGGQIVISHTTFSAISSVHREKLGVMFMGEYNLTSDHPEMPLYQVPVQGLEPRLASFPPLRTKGQLSPGVIDAPVGMVTVVFMNAIGVPTLLSWNADVTRAAITVYHSTVSRLLPQYHGHKVEVADGLCLIAFQRPEDAVAWALEAQANLLEAPWPAELLKHELCEPISTMLAISLPDDEVNMVSKVHSIGLRLKVGIALGAVVDSVQASTGAMGYRGKVMNRAARVCSSATTGQVLVMSDCWNAAKDSEVVKREAITAASAGLFRLKGIDESVELHTCTYTTAKRYPVELKTIRSAPNPAHNMEELEDEEPLPDQTNRVLRPYTTWAPRGTHHSPLVPPHHSPVVPPRLEPLQADSNGSQPSPLDQTQLPLPPSHVLPLQSSTTPLLPRSSGTI